MSRNLFAATMAFAMLAAPEIAAAQSGQSTTSEEIVVTATRARGGLPREQIGGSVTQFSGRDLELRQVQVVSDLLRDSPGVEVSRSGPVGALTQIYIRGAEGNHTLALIDGMDVSDPFSQEFDFSSLIADDFARVEVLRGQQSALYGSDAIGGVIHYITATGEEAPGVRARAELGSFGTSQGALRLAGVQDDVDYAVSGNVYRTDGVPSAPNGSRDLSFDSWTGAARVGVQLSEALSLTGVLRTRESQGEYNSDVDASALVIDTPGAYFEDQAAFGLVRADLALLDGRWTHALIVQGVDAERQDVSPFFTSSSEGARTKASYVTTFRFGGEGFDQRVTGAVDQREDEFETVFVSEHSVRQTGVVLEYNALINERLGLGLAMRHDDNSLFDNATTYRAQASYAFDTGTRLRAAAGSGVKNPTMAELFGFFGTFAGNPNLTPEESDGWEVGVEQYLFDRDLLVGVTYFDNELTDEIGSVTVGGVTTPINKIGLSNRQGIEVFGRARFGEQWAIDLAYTHLDADEPLPGGGSRRETRRPEDTASANISWRMADDRGGLNLNVRYSGEQDDVAFPAFPSPSFPVTLDSFTLVTLGGDWRINDQLQLYGRVENATDEDYQEVYGYATAGRASYIGLRAGF